MTITPGFVTLSFGTKPDWKADENFHIYTKSKDSTGKDWDLVFLSGYLAFDFGTLEDYWVHDSLIFSFNDLKWFVDPAVQIAPVVSLGTISNIQNDEAETIGWGIDSTQADLIPGPSGSRIIQLTCQLSIRGVDTHLEKATYYVAAMGRIHK